MECLIVGNYSEVINQLRSHFWECNFTTSWILKFHNLQRLWDWCGNVAFDNQFWHVSPLTVSQKRHSGNPFDRDTKPQSWGMLRLCVFALEDELEGFHSSQQYRAFKVMSPANVQDVASCNEETPWRRLISSSCSCAAGFIQGFKVAPVSHIVNGNSFKNRLFRNPAWHLYTNCIHTAQSSLAAQPTERQWMKHKTPSSIQKEAWVKRKTRKLSKMCNLSLKCYLTEV